MKIRKKYNQWKMAAYTLVVFIMSAALFFCFSMIDKINQRMNESATSNLLNTTKVIEGNVESDFEKDFEFLSIIAEMYKSGRTLEEQQMQEMAAAMKVEWVAVVDANGKGVDCFQDTFQASEISGYDQWEAEKKGFSDAYFGDSGRLQTTLWLPVYRNQTFIGTVFASVTLSKYYSEDVFTFYEGEGRTYLFDGSDGKWILRSMGTDGTIKREDDIYSLLKTCGNDSDEVLKFRQAVKKHKTGTAVFDFNQETSYVCFMPLAISDDWYVATVIPRDVLLKESAQVQRIIQLILVIFVVSLCIIAITFLTWRLRREKQKAAEYREALFANVSSNIDAAFLIYEKEGSKPVFVSDNVKRLLGIEREWLEENGGHLFDWCDITENDSQKISFLDGTLEQPAVREVCVKDEMGIQSRYIRLELIPADSEQQIAVLTDITKDKDIQSSLLESMRQAEAASHAKNDFLSAMSHDIRTPMNGIVGMTAIAAANVHDEKRVQSCLTKINEASAHLLNLINEVLDMSKIENGQIEIIEEPFNLAQMLQEVLSINYPGIQQKDHTIKVHIRSLEHEQVLGDPMRLRRIVTNLISNAIKYTPEGGKITLALKEKSSKIKGYGCYEIMVQDNGIGMTPEFQEKIFLPFEREEDVRISRIQGTGLGMTIVKNLVSLMMGEIQVDSQKNQGTTFRVTINLKLDEDQGEAIVKLDSLPVLVVDDDDITCETVSSMLCDIGMTGEWADNGLEAIRMVSDRHSRKEDYMAVLLDWKMPGMDGIETARRIRRQVDENVPIIILTAYDWSEIEVEAREAGVNEFLLKPIYKTKLRKKMMSVVSGTEDSIQFEKVPVNQKVPSGKRVLIVEDNELNMEIAVELLQMMGAKTACARNGVEAVECFADSAPGTYNLILMDIQMPKMNGYEAAKKIRAMERPDSQTIPIVAMTADAFVNDVQSVYAAGMNEHLSKPVSVERLKQTLIRFLSETDHHME